MVVSSSDFAGYGGCVVCPYHQQKPCGWSSGNHSALCADRRVCGGHFCGATADLPAGREDLFNDDMIHLNHEGQMLWYNNYIKPAIEQVITENHLESLRNTAE